jgi:SAM-dependent methyltransferase
VTAEYVDDVPYVRHFVDELSPPRLRLVAALNGIAPPPGNDFDYLELGCAHGDTLAALAAAHPDARFVGIDISKEHIAQAKRLARDGGLENVGFLERDFSSLAEGEIGEFDYITAHGVLSWISPEKRTALIALAAARLKPGGILYVTYNAMPGWAAVEPLRQLLLFNHPEGTSSLERAKRGVAFARELASAGAAYFTKNPAAAAMLETISKTSPAYVAHEYLHDHWSPMYFARIAWEMAQQDLHFAGVLPEYLNFRDTALPEEVERMIAALEDRHTFESLKDFAVDEYFRRDLYVRGRVKRSDAATAEFLDATPFAILTRDPPRERVIKLPHRTVDLSAPIYDALFSALAAGSATLEVLASRMPASSRGGGCRGAEPPDRSELRRAMTRLLVAGHAFPARTAAKPVPADAAARVLTIPSPYNQMMLRRLSSETPFVLASSVAGTAFPVSALDGVAIRALTSVAEPERAKWIHDLVERSVMRLRVGDRVIEDRSEQRRAIEGALADLCANRLSKMIELGVLT